jgi:hypothetical protein
MNKKFKKGEFYKIIDGSEWDGHIGIVKEVVFGIAYIFCVQHPTHLYKVHTGNIDKVIQYDPKQKEVNDDWFFHWKKAHGQSA